MLSSICYNWRDYLCKERYLMIKRTFTADIETEIKIMITKDEYQILFSKGHNIHTQINHYYKITDDLTVRIRKMNNEFFLQYKVNNDGVQLKGLKDKTEYSMKLHESDYLIIKNNPDALWVYLEKDKPDSYNVEVSKKPTLYNIDEFNVISEVKRRLNKYETEWLEEFIRIERKNNNKEN